MGEPESASFTTPRIVLVVRRRTSTRRSPDAGSAKATSQKVPRADATWNMHPGPPGGSPQSRQVPSAAVVAFASTRGAAGSGSPSRTSETSAPSTGSPRTSVTVTTTATAGASTTSIRSPAWHRVRTVSA
jgi:hypothetical protein